MFWGQLRVLTCQGGLQGCFRGLVSLRMLRFQAALQGEVSQWHSLKAETKIPRVEPGNKPMQPSDQPPQEQPLEDISPTESQVWQDDGWAYAQA